MLRADQEFDHDDEFSPVYCVVCREQIARAWSNANEGRCMACAKKSVSAPAYRADSQVDAKLVGAILAVGLGSVGLYLAGTWMFNRADEALDEASSKISTLVQAPAKQAITDPPIYSVDAERLVHTYSINEVAANGQYSGRPIAVTGTIFSVDDSPLAVHLEGGGILSGVICEFTPDWRNKLTALGKGQRVRIVGVVKGKESLFVRLARCRVEP